MRGGGAVAQTRVKWKALSPSPPPRRVFHENARLHPHPVAAIQRSHFKNELDGALFIAERVYGAHAAWQMKLDRALVRRARGAWRAVWRRRD